MTNSIQSIDTAELDIRLGLLQNDARGHFAEYRRTHEKLYDLMARLYLWWRAASAKPEYVESIYRQRGIGHKSTGHEPNFSPLIRLVWGMEEPSPSDRATISQWNKALRGMDEQFCEHPEEFAHNAVGKLVAFVEGKGGVVGFQNGGQIERDEPQIDNKPLSADAIETLSRLATTVVATLPGMGSATVNESIRVGQDGLVLLLGRSDTNGNVTVLGSCNDPEQIKKASINAIRRDLTGLPPQFRAIVETMSTQTFPSHALPSSPEERATWFDKKFSDETDLWGLCNDDCRPKGTKSKTTKRLLVRPVEGDLLLSSNMTPKSPVTRCIPNEQPFGGDSTYLALSEISRVERWIESGEMSLLRFNGEEQVEDIRSEDGVAYALSILDSTSGYSQRLSFYEHTPDRDIAHTQGEFDRERFRPDWTVQLAPKWFGKVREVWADEWFAGLGKSNQITRSHNAVLDLKVEAQSISIIFNQREGAITPTESFTVPTPIDAHGQKYSFFSKDVAPVLANLADVPAIGEIVVSGNEHALLFEYATPIGRFEIAIPTLRADSHERDGALFKPADSVFPVEVRR
jgi:hypothetical protein